MKGTVVPNTHTPRERYSYCPGAYDELFTSLPVWGNYEEL